MKYSAVSFAIFVFLAQSTLHASAESITFTTKKYGPYIAIHAFGTQGNEVGSVTFTYNAQDTYANLANIQIESSKRKRGIGTTLLLLGLHSIFTIYTKVNIINLIASPLEPQFLTLNALITWYQKHGAQITFQGQYVASMYYSRDRFFQKIHLHQAQSPYLAQTLCIVPILHRAYPKNKK